MPYTSRLNYDRVMALNPAVYTTVTNHLGQAFELLEHPTKGDESFVLIAYHAERLIVYSDFFDTADLANLESDYYPIYLHGEIHPAFEVDYGR